MKVHNFGAGPCILPQTVFKQAAEAVIELDGIGLSLLEISHRSKAFDVVMEETQSLVRSILGVPDDYHVLFLQGGASMQFAQVPMNFLAASGKAAYLDTGVWSKKAIKEAKLFGQVEVVASGAPDYCKVPKDLNWPADASYAHITTNNTIYGTELFNISADGLPLVADMSSDIFSRQINVADYSLIYAGAQKNIGPAGMTLVILKDEFLAKKKSGVPSMLDYEVHVKANSLYNTPPVFAIYTAMLNLRWLKEQGGLAAIEQMNIEKAELLYKEIDNNPVFVAKVPNAEDRSRMNVTFTAKDEAVEEFFLKICAKEGIHGIKGHRSAGGFRASLYNALPLESVQHLVNVMQKTAAHFC